MSVGGGKVTKAVLPVAGLGTRFLPATKAIPKEMLPIVDKPSVQLVVEEAVGAGITDIIFITGRGKGEIEDHFDISYELESVLEARGKKDLLFELKAIDEMIRVIGVRQKEAKGLGHAVGMAEGLVGKDEHFAVLLGDDLVDSEVPCIAQLVRVHEETGKAVVAVMTVPQSEVSKYGVVGGTPAGKGRTRVTRMVEKPKENAPSDLAVIGRYVLPGRVFELLRKTRTGVGGEIQLTDALNALAAEEPGVIALEFEGQRYDAGDKVGYLEANLAWAMKNPQIRDQVKALCKRFAG